MGDKQRVLDSSTSLCIMFSFFEFWLWGCEGSSSTKFHLRVINFIIVFPSDLWITFMISPQMHDHFINYIFLLREIEVFNFSYIIKLNILWYIYNKLSYLHNQGWVQVTIEIIVIKLHYWILHYFLEKKCFQNFIPFEIKYAVPEYRLN